MSILDGIKDKAKELLSMAEPYARRQTAVYDASKNRVVVAGFNIDGLVSATVSADTLTKQETGIDYGYTTYYEAIEQKTLSVNVLPTAQCLDVLKLLALKQQDTKGWFNIAVHENDKVVNVYRGWVIDLPEIGMQQDAGDRTVVFGIKSMFSGVSVIDQPIEPLVAIKNSEYGANPDQSGANSSSTINENTNAINNTSDSSPADNTVLDNGL